MSEIRRQRREFISRLQVLKAYLDEDNIHDAQAAIDSWIISYGLQVVKLRKERDERQSETP